MSQNLRRTYHPKLFSFSRELRKNSTEAERHLWCFLRRKQMLDVQFYRQRPIGFYIVDFYAPSVELAIELDGSQHFEDNKRIYDERRDNYLNNINLNVLRFSNTEVLMQTSSVLQKIFNYIADRKA